MKNRMPAALIAVFILLAVAAARAADAPGATNAVLSGLKDVVGRVNVKLQAGQNEAADLAGNLKEFDDLIAKNKDAAPADLAGVLEAKAELYLKILHDPEGTARTLAQLQHDYPSTEMATNAAAALPRIQDLVRQQAASRTNVLGGLNNLIGRINVKLKAGQDSAADLAGELKEFDLLIAAHKGEDPADLSHVLSKKLELCAEVVRDYEGAAKVAEQIIHDYPGTPAAQVAEDSLGGLNAAGEKIKIQNALAEQTVFPPFSEMDLDGKPLSTANYKGKVLLVDFWATWCPACRMDLPNVIDTFHQYHDKGFDIIGINLDKAGARDTLLGFLHDNQMNWPEYYDGQYWNNKLVLKYGVMAIPMNYLLDKNGIIVARNLHGPQLGEAIAKALAVK